MERSPAENIMLKATALSAACTIGSILLYRRFADGLWLTMAITAGTFLYHLAMRLLVGLAVRQGLGRRVNNRARWFLVRESEEQFYRKIKIQKWKKRLPTYYPQDFSLKQHSMQELIQTMCISELSHEVMLLLSYVPLLLSVWFGAFYVFLLTSVCAGAVDAVFVLVQRYNRGRLVKVVERNRKALRE